MAEGEQIKIKDYQIHSPPLGEGAFGRVYRATYRGISDRALKIFRPGAVDLSTMARELEKLSKVAEHQGIVTLHDFDLLNDPPYYAMGLHADHRSEGDWETRTLEKLCGTVDPREGWRLARDIADALAYLHQHQIVHCDIKPSNILLTDESPYHIKICDFGQSRGLAAEGFEPVGTPLYASPEQLRDPRASAEGKGFRWDVYSFGVVIYKLLTGNLPRLQGLADAERKGYDPEATVRESSLEATLAETGNAIDGEQLATMTEAVEEIHWPVDLNIPTDRRDLIEQCLRLDPNQRPADMREVWGRIQQLDQQAVVKRARRLNTIFATLLVVAIWASGFAFVQAQKAKEATQAAMIAKDESEQSAGAAVDLMRLFVSELNKGDISGAGADRLYSIVAENASTFLENRYKDRQASTRILRFSAQTASLRGRQALERGELESSLEDFTRAYEIRSELASDPNSTPDLAMLASRDLMEIGKIHELESNFTEAVSAYTRALEWRNRSESEDVVFSALRIREIARIYKALARVHFMSGNTKDSLATMKEILEILSSRMTDANSIDFATYSIETIRVLELKGSIEYRSEDPESASPTYQEIRRLSEALDQEAPPSILEEARLSYVNATNALGLIQRDQEQLESALVLFREEIKLREETTRTRPYEAEERVALAAAYALAADCLDLDNETSRSLAIFYLEQGMSRIDSLPSEIRNRGAVQSSRAEYEQTLSRILELEE